MEGHVLRQQVDQAVEVAALAGRQQLVDQPAERSAGDVSNRGRPSATRRLARAKTWRQSTADFPTMAPISS